MECNFFDVASAEQKQYQQLKPFLTFFLFYTFFSLSLRFFHSITNWWRHTFWIIAWLTNPHTTCCSVLLLMMMSIGSSSARVIKCYTNYHRIHWLQLATSGKKLCKLKPKKSYNMAMDNDMKVQSKAINFWGKRESREIKQWKIVCYFALVIIPLGEAQNEKSVAFCLALKKKVWMWSLQKWWLLE